MKSNTSAHNFRKWIIAFFCFGGLILASLSCNNAQTSVAVGDEVTGETMFISYCQICHGEHGDGAMADLIKVDVPDLTLISARRGGQFPKDQIYKIIDGQEEVIGHGSIDMPIWGQTFKESESLQTEAQVKERIDKLVDYLEAIQQKEE